MTTYDLIELLPIAAAPVKPGEYFGPCLLTPSLDDVWTVGRWNGDDWYEGGLPIAPTHYALLPVGEEGTVTADRDPFALARAEPNG